MVRLATASAYILGFAAVSISAFHLPVTTPLAARTTDSTIRMSTTSAPADTDLKSESAKKQIGNDSFLNEDLMAHAQNGPGVKNNKKLKISIVGAGLAGMVAAMDLADAR